MFSPASAPDVTETVVEAIREHRKYLNSGSRSITEHHVGKEIVGRFSAVAEAVVEVGLHSKFSKRYGEPPRFIEERTVQLEAFAQCTGHGCVDPEYKAPASEVFLLAADADKTAPAALPLVAAARAWAQKHAETCRALPYEGR
jgi:hypothetical protein